MKKEIHFKIYHKLLYIFAFVLPFSTPSLSHSQGAHFYFNITPALVGLFLLNWLAEADFKAKFQRIKENKLIFPFFAVVGFYVMHLIGLTYTPDLSLGKTDILLKLPFLLLPLIVFTSNSAMWKPKSIQNLLYTFALGNLFAVISSLISSFLRCGETFSVTYFHYANASFFFHSSYASMYYCFSFVIVFYLLINRHLCLWKKITAWLMFFLFPLEIVLLDSRTGLLAFAVVMLVFALYIFIFHREKILRFLLYMSMLAAIFTASYYLLPQGTNRLAATFYRMKSNIADKSRSEEQKKAKTWNMEQLNEDVEAGKIDARAQTLSAAVEVLKEYPVFGVGTGGVKKVLMEKYIKYNFHISQKKELNAHNQFLQVAVSLGFVGFTIFLAFLVSLFWLGWKKRNILLILFGLIGIVNFLTESMLERQVGVMFFAFFFALLSYFAATNLFENEQNKTK